MGSHMKSDYPTPDERLQADNDRLRAEIARMHEYLLGSEEARKNYWDIAHERGKEVERMRLAFDLRNEQLNKTVAELNKATIENERLRAAIRHYEDSINETRYFGEIPL